MDTPILFLVFNRPKTTKKVFLRIKKIKPKRLFVAADGPRWNKATDEKLCKETRSITEDIDWKCEVERLYRDKNLGCKVAVSSAIDWFFDKAKEGIILEDDCLPNKSFFEFCERMLYLYRNNRKVMHIGGVNFQSWDDDVEDGYYFSKYVHIWGWATWRRVWEGYDVNMSSWPTVGEVGGVNKYYDNLLERNYWNKRFSYTYNGKIDTWDYQYVYHVWKNGGVSVIPNKNLVSNIGFGEEAKHTKLNKASLTSMKTYEMDSDYKKMEIQLNKSADSHTRRKVLNINFNTIARQKLRSVLIS